MVVDTSAVIATFRREPGYESLQRRLMSEPWIMAAPNRLEAHMVAARSHGDLAKELIDKHLEAYGVRIVPFEEAHAIEACRAFDRFGKGRHPAALNFGDCIAYALAKVSNQPLLFVGDDFSKTDIRAA